VVDATRWTGSVMRLHAALHPANVRVADGT
jgi:hypothetical protein